MVRFFKRSRTPPLEKKSCQESSSLAEEGLLFLIDSSSDDDSSEDSEDDSSSDDGSSEDSSSTSKSSSKSEFYSKLLNTLKDHQSLGKELQDLHEFIADVHMMKFYYTVISALQRSGALAEEDASLYILGGLEKATNLCLTSSAIADFKLILEKAEADGVIERREFFRLDNEAEVHRIKNDPDILNLMEAVKSNTARIEGLEANVEAINNSVNKIRKGLKHKMKVEAAVGFLSATINAISFGVGGSILDATSKALGSIVDFGDIVHIQAVAARYGDVCVEQVEAGAEIAVNRYADYKLEEAVKKGNILTVVAATASIMNSSSTFQDTTAVEQGSYFAAKAKGDQAFRQGDFAQAVKHYSVAISKDELSKIYFCDRSAAYLNMGDAQNALLDAESAIMHYPDYLMGYFRKGKALHKLGRLKEAEVAFEKGLAICPSDTLLKDGLNQVREGKEAICHTIGCPKVGVLIEGLNEVREAKDARLQDEEIFNAKEETDFFNGHFADEAESCSQDIKEKVSKHDVDLTIIDPMTRRIDPVGASTHSKHQADVGASERFGTHHVFSRKNDSCMSFSRRVMHKDKQPFREGNFVVAVDYFTKATDIDDSNHLHFSGNPASYLKSHDAERALSDAPVEISLSRTYPKEQGKVEASSSSTFSDNSKKEELNRFGVDPDEYRLNDAISNDASDLEDNEEEEETSNPRSVEPNHNLDHPADSGCTHSESNFAAKAKGDHAFRQGDFAQAVKCYSIAIIHDDSNCVYFSNRSAAYLQMGDAQNALLDATSAIMHCPDQSRGYFRKGKALEALNRFEEAEAAFKEGLVICPRNSALLGGLDQIKEVKKSRSQSEEMFKSKGDAAFRRSNFAEAVGYYTKAIGVNALNHVLFSNRSVAYLKLGDAVNALSDASAAIAINHEFARGYYRKGKALLALGRSNEAVEAFEEAYAICPGDFNLQEELRVTKENVGVVSSYHHKECGRQPASEHIVNFEQHAKKDQPKSYKQMGENIGKAGAESSLEEDLAFSDNAKDMKESTGKDGRPDVDPELEVCMNSPVATGSDHYDSMDNCIARRMDPEGVTIEERGADKCGMGLVGASAELGDSCFPMMGRREPSGKHFDCVNGGNDGATSSSGRDLEKKESITIGGPINSVENDFKTKGDQAFREGRFLVAVEYYTKAIDHDDANHLCFSNRAASYLKLDDAENALLDASVATSLCRTFPRGHLRKGQALHALHRLGESISAFEEGLSMCPGNGELEKCLLLVQQDLHQSQQRDGQIQLEKSRSGVTTNECSNHVSTTMHEEDQNAKSNLGNECTKENKEVAMQSSAISNVSDEKDSPKQDDNIESLDEVSQWLLSNLPSLKKADVVYYTQCLVRDGFDSTDMLSEVSDEDDLHFMKKAHKRVLVRKLNLNK